MSLLVCPHQPSCPGCPRLAEPGLPARALERLSLVAEHAGIEAPRVHPSPALGFRRRARLAIRGRADAPKLGLFRTGTHQTVHIPRCLVHHPVVNRVAAQTRDCLARHRVPTYSDDAHLGVARYLQIVVERESDRAQVTLVTNGNSPAGLEPLFADLERSLAPNLHSLWWNGNPERTNTILGPYWRHLAGPEYVSDRSGNARIFYPPDAFGQSNLDLAMELADRARQLCPPGTRVTEYYAGVGAIGLGLAAKASRLRLNELGEGSLRGLRRGIEQLGDLTPPIEVYAGTAGDHSALVAQSDYVIADPPRKGLDPELVSALVANPPPRFAYISCDLDSLERDMALLLPHLRLTALEVFDLFPHTEHVETLAIFGQSSG